MRTGRRLGLTLTVLAAVSLVGCAGQSATVEQEQIKVVRGNIVQSVNADGELSLPQHRKLTFGVNGEIAEITVEEGDKANKGQLLARLDTAPLERTVKTAELAVKAAEADRLQAEAGLKSARTDLEQAKYGVQNAETDLQQAQTGIQTAEANLGQAEYAVKTAEVTREQASDNFRKITYPYTFSTFSLDIPQAMDSISTAERQVIEAAKALQTGLTTEQYALASRQLQDALDNLVNARQRLGRGQGSDVFTSGILTVKDFWTLRDAQLQMDKAELGLNTAKGALAIARLAVDTARSAAVKTQLATGVAGSMRDKGEAGVNVAESALSKAQLAVDSARYNLDTARETLDKAVITAPFDGVVARVNIKTGDVLTPVDYTRVAVEFIDPRRMEFTIKVDEIDVPGVKLGQEAAVTIDALPGFEPKGKVTFVSPLPEVTGGVVQYPVKIGFEVSEGSGLRAGMSANAVIVTAQRSNVLIVPSRAVIIGKSGTTVKVLVDGQIQERVVQAGISNGLETEIVSGLSEGDTVILERQAKSGSVFLGG